MTPVSPLTTTRKGRPTSTIVTVTLASFILLAVCYNTLWDVSSTNATSISTQPILVSTTITTIMSKIATFETSMGTFKAELYGEQMPITVGNFIDLANSGFYDGIHFHRVIPNFMDQVCGLF
mmetsp:Transcript_26714/g.55936  ORF Transcript_26714/g.55936 Transcript_26714/m.55936 type:complete len:122 (-) Transcript_26714:762-1127(-)